MTFFTVCSNLSLLSYCTVVLRGSLSGVDLDLVRPIIWLVVGFALENLSVQSLYFPFSELCLPRPGHCASCKSDVSLNLCIPRPCHQASQLSRFLSWCHPSIPGIDLMAV